MALFNILNAAGYRGDIHFLDLFSGTGEVAGRALQNGAARVVAVEADRQSAAYVKSRLAQHGETGNVSCICGDVRRILPRLAAEAEKSGGTFEVVFADPPYHMGWGNELPPLFERSRAVLSPGGVFVFERSIREKPAEISIPRDDRMYGETVLSFYWSNAMEGEK